MADFNQINQFGSAKPARSGKGMSCAECEAMLTDFIDGALSAKDKIAFDLHIATCKECGQMLGDAQRGAALLEMLKAPRPEPSPSLVDRILARTSFQTDIRAGASPVQASMTHFSALGPQLVGAGSAGAPNLAPVFSGEVAPFVPTAPVAGVLPFRPGPAARFNLQAIGRTLMQPRLAMTAAMAFFSIALTLNLTGVHLNELRASDLKPSSLKHTFYQADASLVRYYENLRVVYELESRLSDLKQSSESDSSGTAAKPESKGSDSAPAKTPDTGEDGSKPGQQRKLSPKAGSGTSQRSNPQPVFRLVANPSSRSTSLSQGQALTAAIWLGRESTNNQSKEELQEGGSV